MRKTLLGLAALTLLAAASPARAGTMDRDLSLWAVAGYGHYGDDAGFGLGGRYQVVVAPRGILQASRVRDEIGLEFGLDWVHFSGWHFYGYSFTYNELSPMVGVTWNFWLNDRLALYPKLDVGFRFGTWSSDYPYGHPGGYGGLAIDGAVGLVYQFDPRVALRVEAGTYAFRFGVAFKL